MPIASPTSDSEVPAFKPQEEGLLEQKEGMARPRTGSMSNQVGVL